MNRSLLIDVLFFLILIGLEFLVERRDEGVHGESWQRRRRRGQGRGLCPRLRLCPRPRLSLGLGLRLRLCLNLRLRLRLRLRLHLHLRPSHICRGLRLRLRLRLRRLHGGNVPLHRLVGLQRVHTAHRATVCNAAA